MAQSTVFERHFKAALSSREKEVFLETLLVHSDIKLTELASLAKGRCRSLAEGVSLADLLEYARASREPSSSWDGQVSAGGQAQVVSTRTAKDRRRFDAAVLQVVKTHKDACSATDVRRALGGTPLQVRRALNRLIEREALTYEGQARGTRYRAL